MARKLRPSDPIRKTLRVGDPDATNGATVGVNLWLEDGTLVTKKMLFEPADDGSQDFEFTYWKLVREVPANVRALEKAAGTGLFVVTGAATGEFREIETTPGELTVSNGSGVAGNPLLGLADVPDAGGGTLQKTAFDAKGRKTGTSAATTDDLPEGVSNLYFTNARADARITLQKGQPNGLATLDGSGKLDGGQLPALAITETFVVANEAAMLALTAQKGDVAVRTDNDTSYILTAEPASTLANWQQLLTPTAGAVTSFNGRTGAVVPQSGDYTAAQVGAEPTIAAGTTAQYRRGDKTWRDFATDVRAAVLTGLSTATNAAITAADSVLSALGKLQAQIDNILATRVSGSWSPVATAVANVSSFSGEFGRYMRVDGVVGFGGQIIVTPTTNSGTTSFRLSLPVGATFGSIADATGVIYVSISSSGAFVASGFIRADTTNNELHVQFVTNTASPCAVRFDGSYEI